MGVVGKGKLRVELFKGDELVDSFECENTIINDGFSHVITFDKPITVSSEESLSFRPISNQPLVEFERASGLMECEACGKLFYDHPQAPYLGYDNKPFLHILCDGRHVKL